MSRTDEHAPYWTWAPWYEPVHHLYCPNRTSRAWQKRTRTEPCNLPERPVRHGGGRTRVYVPLCTWEPVWPGWNQARWLSRPGRVPKWYVDHVWNRVERRRERDGLLQLCKEYNATGDLDDGDFANWQARHCARWLWD